VVIIRGQDVGIYSLRESLQGTPLISGAAYIPLLVGLSDGKNVRVDTPEAVTHSTIGGTDCLDYGPLSSVVSIADSTTGAGTGYTTDDYSPTTMTVEGSSVVCIDWSANTTIEPPTQAATSLTDGALVADTYYYVITSLKRRYHDPVIYGETTRSNEESATTNSTSGGVILTWTPQVGAEGYRIYRTTTEGTYTTPSLLVTITSGATITYTDDGSIVPLLAGSPSAVNDAYKQPAVGVSYYVDYYYKTYDYLNRTKYTSLEELQIDHGYNSQLGVAGRLILGDAGRGADSSQCWVIAIETHSSANHTAAMGEAKRIEDLLVMVPLTTNLSIQQSYFAHCVEMSNYWNKKERYVFCGAPRGTEPGDSTQKDTIIYNARTFGSDGENGRRCVYVAPDAGYINIENVSAGTVTETLYDSYMIAAQLAGLVTALPDPAEPATMKRVYGFSKLYEETYDITDNVILKSLNENGVCSIKDFNGVLRVYRGTTTALDTIENNELNISMADDYLAKLLRDTMIAQNVVGLKVTPQLLRRLEDITRAVLNTMQNDQIISYYQDVKAYQDSLDERIVWIAFNYAPIYPANVIVFKRGFVL